MVLDEPVVEQVPGVALAAVGIEHFLAHLDVLQALNDKPIHSLLVVPDSLLGVPMVEHVCEWYQHSSLDPVYENTEESAADHHPGPAEILEGVLLSEPGVSLGYSIVVLLQLDHLLQYHVQEGRALQHLQLLLVVVDGEAAVVLGQ